MKFNPKETYLVKKEDHGFKAIYECLVCGGSIKTYKKRIENKEVKTCGCKSGIKPLAIDVTRDGKILSPTGLILNTKMAHGYEGYKSQYVHRLVAEKFIPNPHGYTDINHKNGNKKDNRVENLEWCDRSHNITHAWRNNINRGNRGKPAWNRQFSDEEVKHIRSCDTGCTTLGRMYGVSKTTIFNIRKFKIYK